MRLREIELRAWRGLSQDLAVLSPRLNLILGPNESGKSRIFQALQFGLFESYKGTSKAKQALQSWTSSESPFVRIAFTDGEVDYELRKQFLKGASAQLSGGGKTLRGEEAEESLRRILGTRQPGSRGAGVDDRGIWPLIMVSQGESRAAVQEHLNADGRDRLHDRLSREIGVAAISPTGQRLMSLVEAEYLRYFTPTGQEGKAIREARAALRSAEGSLAAATEALQRQEKTALALASSQVELVDLEARAGNARTEADAARNRAEAAQMAGQSVATARGVLNTSVLKVTSTQESLSGRQQADATIQRLADELRQLKLDIWQRSGPRAELEESARLAEQRFVEVERQQRRAELTIVVEDLHRRIAGLEQLELAIADARASRAGLPVIDDANLSRLKQLDQVSRATSAKLQGAAVNIVVHLKQDAVIDGVRRAAGEAIEIHVVENQRIRLGELAEVEIRPGSGELERLRATVSDAAAALESALRTVGVESVARAEEIHDARTACERQLVELGKQVEATSAKPLAQLREDYASGRSELERLGPGNLFGPDAPDTMDRVAGARDSARAALAEFRNTLLALRTRSETLHIEGERFVRQYTGRPTVEQLQVALDTALVERERATVTLSDAQREFADLGGAEVQADARRLAIAAEGLTNRLREVRSAGDQLQGELRTLMLSGHYESKEEAASKVEQAGSDLSRLERQAAAAKRLWETLGAERRRVVEKLTMPVTLRVRPYLQELFPGYGLDAGEGLEVLGLQSNQLNEPFGELSGGAQEQLSLVTRIGLAEVLAAEGTLPLILDDALINTDPQRIRRIQRMLFRAADNLQIILFSCHDVLFDGLGAEFVRQLERRRH